MFYMPELGRFLSRDMIRRPGHNLYTYSVNNPANKVDPSGLQDIGYQLADFTGPTEKQKKWEATPTTVDVIYEDAEGLLRQEAFDLFTKILDEAVAKSKCWSKKKIKWNFKPGKKPKAVGWTGPDTYTYYVTASKYIAISPSAAGYTTKGDFQTELSSEIIRGEAATYGGSSQTYVANTLAHELIFHGIAGNYDYWGWFSDSETGKDLDLTRRQALPDWTKKPGFLPPSIIDQFLYRLGPDMTCQIKCEDQK